MDTTNPEGSVPRGAVRYILKLYVAGSSASSVRAVERAHAFCETYLGESYELAVIDLYQQPELASQEQIVATPTLVRHRPLPLRQLIGDLSNTQRILAAFEVVPPAGER